MAGNPFDREIMGVTHRSKETSQQKPGIEMRLYQQKYCQVGNNDSAEWRETIVLLGQYKMGQ